MVILYPRRLFIRCILWAILSHLMVMIIFSFNLTAKAPQAKPLMTFLGSILSRHDLDVDTVDEKGPATVNHESISSSGLITTQSPDRQFSISSKPTFSYKISPLKKKQFKPPQEFFISQDFIFKAEGEESSRIPDREPLRLEQ